MSSPKRNRAKPIESVELKLAFKADMEALRRIMTEIPSAVMREGSCEVVIRGETPAEVVERVKKMLEVLRSKGFK